MEFARRFTKGKHAFVVCTNIDKAHIHNHIIWSSVDLDCDRKFRNFWGSTRTVRRLSDTICIENGLSIVEDPKPHGKSYDKWLVVRLIHFLNYDLSEFPSAALSSIDDATASPHSSALQSENSSCVIISNMNETNH